MLPGVLRHDLQAHHVARRRRHVSSDMPKTACTWSRRCSSRLMSAMSREVKSRCSPERCRNIPGQDQKTGSDTADNRVGAPLRSVRSNCSGTARAPRRPARRAAGRCRSGSRPGAALQEERPDLIVVNSDAGVFEQSNGSLVDSHRLCIGLARAAHPRPLELNLRSLHAGSLPQDSHVTSTRRCRSPPRSPRPRIRMETRGGCRYTRVMSPENFDARGNKRRPIMRREISILAAATLLLGFARAFAAPETARRRPSACW